MITVDIQIDELIRRYPDAIAYLIRNDLPCVVCGEPFWGTLIELADQKGFTRDRIEVIVAEFNKLHP
ncbi:MAG: DUF1858 domain-containing protein [bacterium]